MFWSPSVSAATLCGLQSKLIGMLVSFFGMKYCPSSLKKKKKKTIEKLRLKETALTVSFNGSYIIFSKFYQKEEDKEPSLMEKSLKK